MKTLDVLDVVRVPSAGASVRLMSGGGGGEAYKTVTETEHAIGTYAVRTTFCWSQLPAACGPEVDPTLPGYSAIWKGAYVASLIPPARLLQAGPQVCMPGVWWDAT